MIYSDGLFLYVPDNESGLGIVIVPYSKFGFSSSIVLASKDDTHLSHTNSYPKELSQSQCAYNTIFHVICVFSKSNSVSLHDRYHPENTDLSFEGSDGLTHVAYNDIFSCEATALHH
jgi:hypothetical protein